MSKLEEASKKIAEARQEYQRIATEAFAEESKKLFEKYPNMENFGVRGYVPYFNDGETCVFSMHTYSPFFIDENEEEQEFEYDVQRDDITNFFDAFDNDFYQEVYGDHIELLVHRDGTVENNDYSGNHE